MALARHAALLLCCCGQYGAFDTGEVRVPVWRSNPVARHVACPTGRDAPTVCTLEGYENSGLEMNYSITSLPAMGLLYETSPSFRTYGGDPKNAPDPIGAHQLPFLLTDPLHRVVYVPPFNAWPPEGRWSSFTYCVTSLPHPLASSPITSEEGLVVLANDQGRVAGSTFDLADGAGGWSISGNLAGDDVPAGGLKHEATSWGGLSRYVYGVDEVQYVDFATGMDRTRWYFEASPERFYHKELAVAYGGTLRFTVRSMYGNFSEVNSPLDWVTLECSSCDSGRGIRIVRFLDEHFRWDGREMQVELRLEPSEKWMRDPLNAALDFNQTVACDVAVVLAGISRLKILGDFTRGGEGIAIDDVAILVDTEQPSFPVECQQGCVCVHNPSLRRPSCC